MSIKSIIKRFVKFIFCLSLFHYFVSFMQNSNSIKSRKEFQYNSRSNLYNKPQSINHESSQIKIETDTNTGDSRISSPSDSPDPSLGATVITRDDSTLVAKTPTRAIFQKSTSNIAASSFSDAQDPPTSQDGPSESILPFQAAFHDIEITNGDSISKTPVQEQPKPIIPSASIQSSSSNTRSNLQVPINSLLKQRLDKNMAKKMERKSKAGVYIVNLKDDQFVAGLAGTVSESDQKTNKIPKEDNVNYLKNADSRCPDWDINFKSKVEPLINLDRTKFVTPVLTYGPNNQLRGFREAVWLAIKLNRTVVVPPFFKHDRTDEKGSIIPPEHRLSINALRQLVPVMDAHEMGSFCDNDNSFDTFFLGRSKFCSANKMTRMNNMINWMGLKRSYFTVGRNKDCPLNRPVLPEDTSRLPVRGPIRLSSVDPPNNYFASEGKCALWLFPYHTVGFTKILNYNLNVDFEDVQLNHNSENYENSKYPNWWNGDISIMAAITQYTPRPKYVQEIGKILTDTLFGDNQEYLAMHWRYDRGDWGVHCDREDKAAMTDQKEEVCKLVINAINNPDMVAEKITDWINQLLNDRESDKNIKGLYIAAPLDSQPLMDAIKLQLNTKLPNFIVATGSDSMPIFKNLYPECPYFVENLHDVFSLLDMEVCSSSKIFLRSGGSSWSSNVAQERHIHGTDVRDFENMELLGFEGQVGFEED